VDTSVLIAGVSAFRRAPPNPENKSALLIRAWVDRRTFTWLVSQDILDEYRDVLRRLKVRRATAGRLLNLLAEAAEVVPTGPYRGLSPDPGDEPFCACAEDGDADFIVTLNPGDFPGDRLKAKVIAPGDPIPGQAVRRRSRLRANR
jgi:predicted nucleic acid-binding protein